MSFENLTDSDTPESPEVFLDTSIHCSRLKGPSFRDRISDVLRRFEWIGTSTYTKVEFGNVVLAQAEYYLRKLDEFNSLEKTRDFIGNVLPHKLHKAKVTWSFNLLNEYGRDDSECTERARVSLRRLMKYGVAFVEDHCDSPVSDGTKCYWASKGVHKRNDGRLVWKSPTCKRTHKRCRIDEFFLENRDLFVKIKNGIDELPEGRLTDQLRGFADVIGQAMEDPEILLDYRTGCKRLADAIIAVESSDFHSFFSMNSAESEILTALLEQSFYFLPPNEDKGVLVQLRPPRGE